MIREVTMQNLKDIDKANQPFRIVGKIVPVFSEGVWSFSECLYEKEFEYIGFYKVWSLFEDFQRNVVEIKGYINVERLILPLLQYPNHSLPLCSMRKTRYGRHYNTQFRCFPQDLIT